MADEKPSIHIDTDWKKQAQEEKRRLAEEAEKRRAAEQATAGAGTATVPGPAGGTQTQSRAQGGKRELPPASFASIVQSIMAQALFYLGDLATASGEGGVNLDMAKHHIDALGILEQKTKGNLSPEEQRFLDAALYETRMRFVAVAGQIINP
ncbi:MAG TPA: DUF1844 domain-containing protein [Tepidisphaeraceae bacterium]|nr:DUF1844 domain-containing protein [Tepidisphaeraceae bacterium]